MYLSVFMYWQLCICFARLPKSESFLNFWRLLWFPADSLLCVSKLYFHCIYVKNSFCLETFRCFFVFFQLINGFRVVMNSCEAFVECNFCFRWLGSRYRLVHSKVSIFEPLFSKMVPNFWRFVWTSVKVKSKKYFNLLTFSKI